VWLDAHLKAGFIGTPVLQPLLIDGHQLNIIWIHWTNTVKTDGMHKTHACIDGSKHAAPCIYVVAQMYASCIEQTMHVLGFCSGSSAQIDHCHHCRYI